MIDFCKFEPIYPRFYENLFSIIVEKKGVWYIILAITYLEVESMNKLQKELKFVPLILAIMGIVSIILFLAFPVAYINNALYDGGINGFSSVFGLSVKIGSTLTLNFSPINGVGLTILILVLLASLCSGFMSKYGRGFYIFSTIL